VDAFPTLFTPGTKVAKLKGLRPFSGRSTTFLVSMT
jgi:hypothetical protein